jgi:mannosyltransferase
VNRKVDNCMVALLLLAAAVRFPGLGARSLWFDEALSGAIARLSGSQVLTNAVGSSHPPGYYFLLHLLRGLGGSEFALRFPSAWCSLAATALVARLGRDLLGRRGARFAALGMALAPFQIYYAQEARMYSLAILLSAGAIWMFRKGTREGDRWAWLAYGLAVSLGLYVHYYMGLVVLALHLWLLLDRGLVRRALPALPVVDGLIALAFLPQLVQFRTEAGEFLGSARWRVVPHPLEPLRTLHYLLFGHIMPLWIVPVGLFLILSLVATVLLSVLRRRDRVAWMLVIVVSLPILVAWLVSLFVTPVYVERSFAVVTPALLLLLARGVMIAPRRSPMPYLGGALLVLMIVGTVLYHALPDPAKPPLREATATVAREALPSDEILHLQDASYLPALYYEPEKAGALVDAGQRLWLSPAIYGLLGGRVVQPDDVAAGDVASFERMWLTVMPGYVEAPQRAFQSVSEDAFAVSRSWDWGAAVQVQLYEDR